MTPNEIAIQKVAEQIRDSEGELSILKHALDRLYWAQAMEVRPHPIQEGYPVPRIEVALGRTHTALDCQWTLRLVIRGSTSGNPILAVPVDAWASSHLERTDKHVPVIPPRAREAARYHSLNLGWPIRLYDGFTTVPKFYPVPLGE